VLVFISVFVVVKAQESLTRVVANSGEWHGIRNRIMLGGWGSHCETLNKVQPTDGGFESGQPHRRRSLGRDGKQDDSI